MADDLRAAAERALRESLVIAAGRYNSTFTDVADAALDALAASPAFLAWAIHEGGVLGGEPVPLALGANIVRSVFVKPDVAAYLDGDE